MPEIPTRTADEGERLLEIALRLQLNLLSNPNAYNVDDNATIEAVLFAMRECDPDDGEALEATALARLDDHAASEEQGRGER